MNRRPGERATIRPVTVSATSRLPGLAALERAVQGEVVARDHPRYDAVRRPADPRFAHVRPEAVVRCRAPGDVAAALAFAREHALPAVARAGGHCFAGTSTTRGVVVDVGPMDGVAVDGDVATVGAGTRLGALYDRLAEHGRTLPAGCGPTVGVAGLALGGGLGVLGRLHGLTCDRLVGADVVLRDGRAVTVDDERHPDLLWALRGGFGARAAVVCALRLQTVAPPPMTTLHAGFAVADAPAVIGAWQDWGPGAPPELAASLVLTVPADPGAAPVLTVFGAMAGTEGDVDALLAGLAARAGADPAWVVRRAAPHREAKRVLAEQGATRGLVEDVPDGHAASRSGFAARPLPPDAVAALLAHALEDRRPGEARELDLTPWGGAYARPAPGATAFPHRDARFLAKHTATVAPDAPAEAHAAARRWAEGSAAIARPWGTGGVYPNFPEPGLEDLGAAYSGPNAPRLRAVAAAYAAT